MKYFITLASLIWLIQLSAQSGVLKGTVVDVNTNEPLEFCNILIQPGDKGATTDFEGSFEFVDLSPGNYNVLVSYIGYTPSSVTEVLVTNASPAVLKIELKPDASALQEIEVKVSAFRKDADAPTSLRRLGIAEIERNPGGNRDISKVLQSLPGVGQSVAFRNDLIIRGGGPNENKFFIEDVETPNINHFATQGASGGPIGILDVNFIRGVDFYSAAYPAYASNALSSVLRVNYIEPREDRIGGKLTVGATDFGAGFQGPIGENGSFLFSVRRSYLQFLFQAIGLPFLPIYNDAQYKVKFKLGKKSEFYTIFLGALDNFELNLKANETEEQRYILSYLPVNEQWSYTNGYVYKYYTNAGSIKAVFSRNMLQNTSEKFIDNDESNPQTLDYASREAENKFRLEYSRTGKYLSIDAGASLVDAKYLNSTVNLITSSEGIREIDYVSNLFLNHYGAWLGLSSKLLKGRLQVAASARVDATDYSNALFNPLDQFSPRASASFAFTPEFSINASVGRYYQLPAYTILGYKENDQFVNQDQAKYIQSDQFAAGLEYLTNSESKIAVEGFYKWYTNYPFSIRNQVSLANLGGDFGVVGNELVDFRSEGRAYGAEFLYQQKLFKGFYGILAYTILRSEFTSGESNTYAPSSWDNTHTISVTGGKRFKHGWEAGFKFRYLSGSPFTPINLELSSQRAVYDANPLGVRDFNSTNSERLKEFTQLDIRIDKKWFFNKVNLNLYLDIQNLLNSQYSTGKILLTKKDENGNPLIDPMDDNKYQTFTSDNLGGNLLPTIGVIFEF